MVSNGGKRGRPRRTEAPLPFLEQIAIGAPVAAASAFCQVHPNTGSRWMKLPSTWDRVQQMRDEMYSQAVGKLSQYLGTAVDTLLCLLASDNEQVRRAAAADIARITNAVREHYAGTQVLTQVMEKLAGLERLLAGKGAAPCP